jgi:hypothetical protein
VVEVRDQRSLVIVKLLALGNIDVDERLLEYYSEYRIVLPDRGRGGSSRAALSLTILRAKHDTWLAFARAGIGRYR